MATKDDGGAAFPTHHVETQQDRAWTESGMRLRDYFAIHAPQPSIETLLSACIAVDDAEPRKRALTDLASWSYAYADAMLTERAK